MTTKLISNNEYLQLLGLKTLADRANAELLQIERAACAITGEEPESGGHTGDIVYGNRGVLEAIKIMDIRIVPDDPKE